MRGIYGRCRCHLPLYLFLLRGNNPTRISTLGFARQLLPWVFLIYITWPLTALYNTLGLQRALLVFNVLFVLAVLIPFSLTLLGSAADFTVLGLVLLGSIARLTYCIWIYQHLLGETFSRPVKLVIAYLACLLSVGLGPALVQI